MNVLKLFKKYSRSVFKTSLVLFLIIIFGFSDLSHSFLAKINLSNLANDTQINRVQAASITFRSASPAVAAASGDITLSMPTGTVENDMMIMAIVAHDNVVIALPAGWTKFNELNNTTALRSTMAWKRAGAGEAGPYTVTHVAGNAIIGAVVSYLGVISTGDPLDVAPTVRANASSLTTTVNTLTTVTSNALVIFTSHHANDFTLGHGDTPYTCPTGPSAFNERLDAETILGADASLAIADSLKSPPGATGSCTESMTGVAAVNNGGLTILKPAPFNSAPTTPTQYNATHSTIIPTGGATTDGATTNVYLDSHVTSNYANDILTPKIEVRDVNTSFTNVATATGGSFLYNPEVPRFRTYPATIYDSANNRMIMFGGRDSTIPAFYNDIWEMRLPTLANPQPVWRKLSPTGTAPTSRNAMVHVYDSVNQRLIIFGGYNGGALGGFYSLTLPSSDDGAWSTFTPTGTLPSNRHSSDAIYDTLNGRMIIFGGYSTVDNNDTWEITLPASLASSTSLKLLPTGTLPSVRSEHTLIYDSANQTMILFAGWGASRTNDTWKLTLPGTGQNGAWTQLAPTGTLPGVRSGHGAIYDPVNQRMIMFMGWDGSVYNNEIWEQTLLASGSGVWTQKTSADGTLPSGRRSVGRIYDTINKRVIIFGGVDSLFPINEPLAVDLPSTGTLYYQELTPMVNNAARDAQVSVYDSANQRMISAFGYGRIYDTALPEDTGYHLNEVWGLSVSDNSLRHISPYMSPQARELPSVVYDSLNNRLVAFGGLAYNQGATLNDTWALSLNSATNSTWTRLAPTGTLPAKRWGASAIYDSANQRMLIFGGKALGDASAHYKDVWELSLTSGSEAWTMRTPGTGGPTSGRWASTAIYDPVNTRMLIFGGRKEDTAVYYNELWELEFSTPGTETWTNRTPVTSPAGRRSHTSVYQGDFAEKKMITFGGYDGTNHYNDVWKLNITTPGSETWTQVTPLGTAPLARRSHSAIYDPVNQRMIIQAGRGAGTPVPFYDDFWQLTLPSSTSSWTWTQFIPDVYLRGSVPITGLTFGTSYHWQSWVTGTSSGDSAKAAYGGNSDVPPAGTDFIISLPAPTVTAINPINGGNNGSVSITSVTGTNFVSTPTVTTVKLTRTGQSDIPCTGFTFTSSTTLSNGNCDLTGAAIGAWNVVVTNPDTQTHTLSGGFTVFFALTGHLISSTYDTGYPDGASFNSIMWKGSPGTGGSVKFQLGSSNLPTGPWSYIGPDGSPLSFYGTTGQDAPVAIIGAHHNNKRYYRYKVYLDFKEIIPGATKPVVDEVIVNWGP